jgi:hypothetical protein
MIYIPLREQVMDHLDLHGDRMRLFLQLKLLLPSQGVEDILQI